MKTKSLLLVSALSLLPLTSMGADAPKAPNPTTGVVTGTTQKGTTAPGASQGIYPDSPQSFPAPASPASSQKGSTAPGASQGIYPDSPQSFPAPASPASSQKGSTAPGASQVKPGGLATPAIPTSTDSGVTAPAPSGS